MPGKEIQFTNWILASSHSRVIESWLLHFQKNKIPARIVEKERKEPKGKLQLYKAVFIEIQKK